MVPFPAPRPTGANRQVDNNEIRLPPGVEIADPVLHTKGTGTADRPHEQQFSGVQ